MNSVQHKSTIGGRVSLNAYARCFDLTPGIEHVVLNVSND